MSEPNSKQTNIPEFSVSDLAFSLKQTIEDSFSHVRVRGELSRISIAGSGHMYSSLKDDQAIIDAICWKGTLSKLSIKPEEGLEVICTGRLSTYPKRSNYQLIIESMELAGEGALLKLLEDRKKKLAAEGLFDEDRKKQLPFLPQTIAVVTSPTGAVIRDILHRLEDRMPSQVYVWPVKVQGDGAAEDVSAALQGLQTIEKHGLQKPDLIIVARGGGSLEDLMAFNEENVVRAIAASNIPVISAIGHETDTTLSDFVADLRAPTPTGAAEIAVPVKSQILLHIHDLHKRLYQSKSRNIKTAQDKIDTINRLLKQSHHLLETKTQQLDQTISSLKYAGNNALQIPSNALNAASYRLKSPADILQLKSEKFQRWSEQLIAKRDDKINASKDRLSNTEKLLEAFSFQNTLKRGFSVIKDENGKLIKEANDLKTKDIVAIEFYKNESVTAQILDQNTKAKAIKQNKKPKTKTDENQQELF